MSVSLEAFMSEFSPEERKEIAEGTCKLIEQERTLRDLRRASDLADEELLDLVGTSRDAIVQANRLLEMNVASIGRFLEAMSGDLQLVARMPDREPVSVTLADLFDHDASRESGQESPKDDKGALRLAS